MQEITSVNNSLVKEVVKFQQKKYRDSENKFLLEGKKCVEEAVSAGMNIDYIFILKEKLEQYQEFKQFKDRLILTNEAVLKKISTTDSSPDIVGIAYKKQYSIKDIEKAKKVVLLENIKDLGNLGTILRSSTAFKADAVILYGKECADVYNPKCVRSAVGNLWKIPIVYIDNINDLQNQFSNFVRVATLPRAKDYLKDFCAEEPLLVMFGSEAEGLSDELVKFSTNQVKIEMAENVESLNLSVSCAIVLYELFL